MALDPRVIEPSLAFRPGPRLELTFDTTHPWYAWVCKQHERKSELVDKRHATLAVTLGGIEQKFQMISVDVEYNRDAQSFRTEWVAYG